MLFQSGLSCNLSMDRKMPRITTSLSERLASDKASIAKKHLSRPRRPFVQRPEFSPFKKSVRGPQPPKFVEEPEYAHLAPDEQLVAMKTKIEKANHRHIHAPFLPPEGLSHWEADDLAVGALLQEGLPDKKVLMAKVKTPWDILTLDKAIARNLNKLPQEISPEELKSLHLRAMFLRDKAGQCVINRAMQSWQGKKIMLGYMIKILPSELKPKQPKIKDLSRDGQLSAQQATTLAESFILKKPSDEQHDLLEKVIGFKDLVLLEEEAVKVLESANQTAAKHQDKVDNTMNLLFLLHDVGTLMASRVMSTPKDRLLYMKHLLWG